MVQQPESKGTKIGIVKLTVNVADPHREIAVVEVTFGTENTDVHLGGHRFDTSTKVTMANVKSGGTHDGIDFTPTGKCGWLETHDVVWALIRHREDPKDRRRKHVDVLCVTMLDQMNNLLKQLKMPCGENEVMVAAFEHATPLKVASEVVQHHPKGRQTSKAKRAEKPAAKKATVATAA
ncbi:MAG: hypothetical protein KBC87_03595 [Candidatus Pacebacteria bacterium]|nr:hypothetical protein [Candidatus Paceibacterota bacterium]